ncbi:MAG: ribosome biogenesis GTP-binding protein YihA/YsxC [Deltaproteobacteria bacterium]|nr:ribosome biogenesis GTP-binding protein YihA/YsxC [Kofleriaceae bacterium]
MPSTRPRSAKFVVSAAAPKDFPPADAALPEVAIAGRSNVGKSSLINALCGADLARTSRTPGRTRLINWFRVEPAKGGPLALVDLPGYGYAQVDRSMRESWRPLIESYLEGRSALRAVVLLVDIRRGAEDEELDFAPWLLARNITVIPVLTKADKLGKAQRQPIAAKLQKDLGKGPALARPILFSAHEGLGLDELWRAIARAAFPPKAQA